jgi:hypothetical protein
MRRGKIRAVSHEDPPMADTPPDRLALDARSPYYNAELLDRGIGIRFKGEERHNIEEYCISEGWVRVPVGKSLDRRGNAMTMKAYGPVEAWFLDTESEGGSTPEA